MTNDELLKSYMDQLARDQQDYREDMRTMQARSDERMEAIKRDIRASIWSAIEVAAAVAGIIVTILR